MALGKNKADLAPQLTDADYDTDNEYKHFLCLPNSEHIVVLRVCVCYVSLQFCD